jgi:hypothetical protein
MMSESPVHQFKVVNNIAASRFRKLIWNVFNLRKIWWWCLVSVGLIISALLFRQYLPIFWPERFKENSVERPLSQGLTVYYPPRMVGGHSYEFEIVHELSDLPTTSPITETFFLDTNWQGASFASI